MLLYMLGRVMCLFIAFLSRMEYQASRINLCRHANDLSTFSTSPNLFGDCEAYGVWPSKSFHPVLLWPFCVLPRVFSVCAMSDPNVNTITIFTFDLLHDFSGSLFLDLVFWLLSMLEMERIGLWATLMLKPRRTFVILSENSLA